MRLKLKERFKAMVLLPEQGDFVTLKIVRELREALSPSEEEITNLEVVQDNKTSHVTWNSTKDGAGVDIPIGPKAFEIVWGILEKLDKDKKLSADQFDLYEIFCDLNNAGVVESAQEVA